MKKGNKKKKIILIVSIVAGVLLVLWLLWFFWLEKVYIFHEQEKQLLDAAERYFELNSQRLPDEENDVTTVELQTLYKEKWITSLYVPKSDQLCDTASWVKVRKEDGENVYYTYLKCGKMESNVDHTGPEITLNGKDEMNVDRGSTYQEPGVKEVVDKQDGKMDVKDVQIKSDIDTSKIGTYTVTYTAYDSLRNKTVKERTVYVVDMLNTVTKNKTNGTGYFTGNVSDNYVWFSSMLWRIVGVNDDGTVKLISAYPVGNMNYNSEKGTFEDSDIKTWLNDYFYDHISDRAKEWIVKDSTWCADSITPTELNKTTCDKQTKEMPVGLLSVQEFNQSLQDGYDSYLQAPYMYWLLNVKDNEAAWVNRNDFIFSDGTNLLSFTSQTLLGVRPVVNVLSDTAIIGGSGTEVDPYLLSDYKQARLQTNLNERQSGEYLMYSGYLWRIMEVDEDGTTKVVMDRVLRNNGQNISIKYENGENDKIYNPKQKGNIGYQISNELNTYVNTDLFVNKEIEVPVYDERATFEAKRVDKYKVRISAPNAYEIFSAKNTSQDDSDYWYLNSSKTDNIKYVMASAGSPFTQTLNDATQAGVKLVAYFNKDVRIVSGTGLREDPYYVKG